MKINKVITFLLGSSFVFFSLGQLARISIPDQPVFFYLFEIFVGCITLILVFRYRSAPFKKNRRISMMTFFAWMLIAFLVSVRYYSPAHNIVAFLYYLRLVLYFVFFIYTIFFFQSVKKEKGSDVIVLTTVWIIFSSFIQYYLYQNLGNLAYLGWDPHLYRVVGLFFDPPITVSIYIILTVYFFLRFQTKNNWWYLSLIIPLLILTFLTYSRGGLLGLIVMCSVYMLKRKNWKLVAIAGVLFIGGFLLIPKGSSEGINLLRTTSIESRIHDYEKAITIWRKKPFMGVGYNHIRYEKDPYEEQVFYGPYNPSHGSTAFHSSFLVILVTGGVIGLVLYIWMLIDLAKRSEFLLYSIVFLSVVSVFDNVLLHPFLMYLIFLLEGYRVTWQKD